MRSVREFVETGGRLVLLGAFGRLDSAPKVDCFLNEAFGLHWKCTEAVSGVFQPGPKSHNPLLSTLPGSIFCAEDVKVLMTDNAAALYYRERTDKEPIPEEAVELNTQATKPDHGVDALYALSPAGRGFVGFAGDTEKIDRSVDIILTLCSIGTERAPHLTRREASTVSEEAQTLDSQHSKQCIECGKGEQECKDKLKKCHKCHQALYCSNQCKRASSKKHLETCVRPKKPSVKARSNAAIPYSSRIPESMPADSLADVGDSAYLHHRPQKKAFGLLIDCFRLRVSDAQQFQDDEIDNEALGMQDDGLSARRQGFEKMLKIFQRRYHLHPPWWDQARLEQCRKYVRGQLATGNWHDLSKNVEKPEMSTHYRSPLLILQLRMLAEEILNGDQAGG